MSGKVNGDRDIFGCAVRETAHQERPRLLCVCEHASNHVPHGLSRLGLSGDVLQSHIAWDLGALAVAEIFSRQLQATLISGQISRLVYDCNRPPEVASAIPEKSEVFSIPGNAQLSDAERGARVQHVYVPFHNKLANVIRHHRASLQLMVTIHSFTPVFHGQPRAVEIGVLHGRDDRFARAMMKHAPVGSGFNIRLNEPYSAQDGVAHTLDLHGGENDLRNVMIELRNDLIKTPAQQESAARFLADWITKTIKAEVDL